MIFFGHSLAFTVVGPPADMESERARARERCVQRDSTVIGYDDADDADVASAADSSAAALAGRSRVNRIRNCMVHVRNI